MTPRRSSIYSESNTRNNYAINKQTENTPIEFNFVNKPVFGIASPVTDNSHLYVAKLYTKLKGDVTYTLSTATILSPNKFVTAASNFPSDVTSVYLSFKSSTTEFDKKKVEVNIKSEILKHPHYDKNTAYMNDVAVILLNKSVDALSTIKMVDKSYSVQRDEYVTMLGFSRGCLEQIPTTVTSFTSCREKSNKKKLDEGKHFCVDNNIITGYIGGWQYSG